MGDLFFLVAGLLVSYAGFEDVIYQGKVCTSGSLSGVMAGRNYNRAWVVDSSMISKLTFCIICSLTKTTYDAKG